MRRKGIRKTVFVCVGLSEKVGVITKTITAPTADEASKLFVEQYLFIPKEILGPFFKKRISIIEAGVDLKFTGETKRAIYDNWFVNAFICKDPADRALLIFNKRVDSKKMPIPKGTIHVPISDLRFI
jgi:hypothetical protein